VPTPLTSQKHAGIPWELGLAETQQTLMANDLRDRIVVQVDGQMKTGRDVVVGALLGAEEFGFATAPLVVSGCIMMRVCHLDTCPVGIATQNPTLRARFSGKPEFVETFFEYIAEEVREYLAALGLRTLEEAVGRVDLVDADEAVGHWKAKGLDLSPILVMPELRDGAVRHCIHKQDHGLDRALDHAFLEKCRPAIEAGHPGAGRGRGDQRGPHGRHPARVRDHPPARWGGAARGDHRPDLPGVGRARASAPSSPRG
jgi:glutamate synthase (NADPH/NADH) large chain